MAKPVQSTASITTPSPEPTGSTREEFLAELAADGLVDGVDIGMDAGRYSPEKCNLHRVIGYPWKREVLQGGARDDGKGWVGYFVRLTQPCPALFGKGGNERVEILEAGRDIIVPPSYKLADELDRIIAGSADKVTLVAIKPKSKDAIGKSRSMWSFHFQEFPDRTLTRAEAMLPALETEDGTFAFGAGNTDAALEKLAAASAS